MVDKNKLNRIKGVLKAQSGGETPTLPKYTKLYNGLYIYSNDNQNWFSDNTLKTSFTGDITPFQNVTTLTTIPGDPNITPTTAVENSQQINKKVEELLENKIIEDKIKPVNTIFMDLIDQLKQAAEKLKSHTINAPTIEVTKEMLLQLEKDAKNNSFGINYQTPEEWSKWEKGANFASNIYNTIGNTISASLSNTDSKLTKGINGASKFIADGIEQMGPLGSYYSKMFKNLATAGDIIQEMGGGTDQQTKMDKWMDSALFSWNIGMLNGFAGKNSDSFGIDNSIAERVGGSYGGSMSEFNELDLKAGKKYGLFSSAARKKTNKLIAEAKQQQNLMSDIADEAELLRLNAVTNDEQAILNNQIMFDGGYNLKYTYAAKHGGILEQDLSIKLEWEPLIELNWELPTFKEGGNVEIIEELNLTPEIKKEEQYPKEYLQFKASLPANQKNTPESEYDTYLGWQLYGKPKNFETAIELGMYTWDKSDNSWHGNTIAWDKTTGVGHFLKPKHHPTLGYELDWFNKGIVTEEGGKQRKMTPKERKEWEAFRSNYTLVNCGNFYKYVSKNKEGGTIDINEELEWIPELQEGGKIRNIDELIEYAKKQNPRFIQRLSEPPQGIKFIDDEGNEAEGSHYLTSIDNYVIPRILEIDGKLLFLNEDEAYKRALDTGNYLELTPEEANIFAKEYKQGWPEFFQTFKQGGSLGDKDIPETKETTQKNVIPEGALHKNKHHMEHAEGLTKKGIPVVDEDGDLQAEIEHSEIIFTLEVTKKLEEYYDIFYSEDSSEKEKDQAATDAGKLLVYLILENTDDRTGLIESCKKGGQLIHHNNNITKADITKNLMKEAMKEALLELLIK